FQTSTTTEAVTEHCKSIFPSVMAYQSRFALIMGLSFCLIPVCTGLWVLATGIHPSDPYGAKLAIYANTKGITVAQLDLCNIINCGTNQVGWRGYSVYMCVLRGHPSELSQNPWCGGWDQVLWNTGPGSYTHLYDRRYPLGQLQKNISLIRATPTPGGPANLLILTTRYLTYVQLTP
ncbi:hypothetical protein GOODEAATRI_004541, partial [Goodea atripinnis]